MANITDVERLNYYEGEYLGAADFEAEQEYHRDMRRRHNVGQHTWGIVNGLDIAQVPNGGKTPGSNLTEVDVYIQPGMAVDGFGREIVSLGKTQLTQDLFAAYYDPNPAAPPKAMYVWISYAQTLLQPPADACAAMNQPNAFGRVQESFAFTVTPTSVGPADDLVVVDGTPMPAPIEPALLPSPPSAPPPGAIVLPYDNSIPYQEFSADDSSVHWYIPLGRVFWDPHNTVFVQQPDDWAAVGRRYVGSVASSIESPTSSLVIRDRFAPLPLPSDKTDPFFGGIGVEVAGSLKVDRLLDVVQQALIGGSFDPTNPAPFSPLTIVASGTNEELIQFRNPTGQEAWLVCENPDGNNPGIHIGEIPSGGNAPGITRLFIQSTLTGVAPSQVNVGIGTATPRNPLAIRAQGAWEELLSFEDASGNTNWHINQNPQGQGFQRGLNFCETKANANFRLFLQEGGNVGVGTALPRQNLTVNGGLNIDQADANNGSLQSGPWPALTFGLTSGEGIASNRNPGANQWGLDFYTKFLPRMSITQGGNVGIGTRSPAADLDIAGDVLVEGNLKVSGGQNIFGVQTFPMALSNQTTSDAFRTWTVDYTNQFESVYLVLAVFQGFSVFENDGNTNFTNTGHVPGGDYIPQHAFVRVVGWNNNTANGVCYCSESNNAEQADNTILFTVVVFGKPKF
jgi:hypothetical protein